MDAYEGATVRLPEVCPMCQAPMEPGYILDRGDDMLPFQSEWVAGEPRPNRWFQGVKVGKARRYAISTLRCEACGYLALYATKPLNDVR